MFLIYSLNYQPAQYVKFTYNILEKSELKRQHEFERVAFVNVLSVQIVWKIHLLMNDESTVCTAIRQRKWPNMMSHVISMTTFVCHIYSLVVSFTRGHLSLSCSMFCLCSFGTMVD